jgi:hypothetical protein
MGPPSLGAPSADRQHLAPAHPSQLANGDADSNNSSNNGAPNGNGNGNGNGSSSAGPAVGAAAAAQQPKVVQTAFIHKLYKCVSAVRSGPLSMRKC